MNPDANAIGFVLRLGKALHTYGYASHQLEEVMVSMAHRLNLSGQFFTTPTSIFASFGEPEHQRTFLLRVEPGTVDLGRLAELEELGRRVLEGQLSAAEGTAAIDRILQAPPLYGRLLTTIAYGVTSAAAARFLGGGAREIRISCAIGLLIGLLALVAIRYPPIGRVFEPAAAFVASLAAALASHWIGAYSVYNATLAGLIVLVPGFTLTVAMTELSVKHLVSGTARLSGASVLFLAIVFGVALGARASVLLVGAPRIGPVSQLPGWTEVVAIGTASLGLTVLLCAQARDAGWIILSGALAIAGGRLGAWGLGPELGLFVGALVVGSASNLYARFLHRPAAVTLVPGILLLVPGSVGFRSLTSLLDQQVVLGVETAFKMVLIAVALVAGMLVANVIVPPPVAGASAAG